MNWQLATYAVSGNNRYLLDLNNTSDLITIATKTKVPLTTVINFFNGCIVLDLVTVYDKSKPVIKKPRLQSQQSCLHRMFNRLLA
jgi:hypothetical protein